MSKKYKEAMDKIVLSDELKSKIIENAAKNHLPVNTKPRLTKSFYFRYGVSYVACLILCFLAVSVSQIFMKTDMIPFTTDTPGTQSPVPAPQETTVPQQPTAGTPEEHESAESQPFIEAAPKNDTVHQTIEETTRPQNDEPADVIPPLQSENDTPPLLENHSPQEDNPPEMSSGNEADDLPLNPATEWGDFSDIRKRLGYDFKIPTYIPEGYKFDTASLLFRTLVQISYVSENDEIVYRTERTMEDISGDYNVYDTMETETINGADTTLKGSDEIFYGAVWNDGEMSYSISSTSGLEKNTLVQIAENVDYPTEQEQSAPTPQAEEPNVEQETQEESSVNAETLTEQDSINTVDQVNENDKEDDIPKKQPEKMDNMD